MSVDIRNSHNLRKIQKLRITTLCLVLISGKKLDIKIRV